ncbi:MAG: Bug family tripartite tricarboxylate transporter substrate binding protein [Burkholderiales bacterium]
MSRIVLLAVFLACPLAVTAQSFPAKPIRLIVPFPPGGGNDTVARAVGQELAKPLGQQVVIDNRPGAGGALGAELAAKAPPDGHTLFLAGVASHGINPALNPKLPYDPIRDFAPVSLLASAPLILVVHPSLPARSVKELIALAKAKPGALNYASNGPGSSSHMAGELFKLSTRTDLVHIPYKGLSPALTDLMSGQVQIMFSSAVAMLPQVKAGRLRGLATTGAKRPAAIPDLPTVAEAGVPGYETGSWYGIVAPAGTPPDIVNRLSAEMQKIVRQPAIQERFNAEAASPVGSTPQEFVTHLQREKERWTKVVKATGPIAQD